MDATYAGYLARNMEMYYDLNAVPDGARYLDSASGEPRSDRQRHDRAAGRVPASVSRLSEHPRPQGNSATGDYHSLQVQVNRRYIHGVQFGGAYTLQRARGWPTRIPAISRLAQPPGS